MTLFSKLPPKDLFFARLYYFTFMGGWGFILPFANLFYVSVRAWASLGWIVSVLTSGQLIQQFGYVAGFIGVSLMWLISSTVIFFIRPYYFKNVQTQDQPKPGLRIAIRRVFQDRTLLGFAIALVFIGFLNSGVLQFENVFLAELGASKQLISVAGILSAIVELPFMIFADRFMHRVGAHRLMLIALSMTIFQRITVLLLPFIPTIMIVRFIGGVVSLFYFLSFRWGIQ